MGNRSERFWAAANTIRFAGLSTASTAWPSTASSSWGIASSGTWSQWHWHASCSRSFLTGRVVTGSRISAGKGFSKRKATISCSFLTPWPIIIQIAWIQLRGAEKPILRQCPTDPNGLCRSTEPGGSLQDVAAGEVQGSASIAHLTAS